MPRSRETLTSAPYSDYDREFVTMLNVDLTLWDSLKARAKMEGKANPRLPCQLIGRYASGVKVAAAIVSNPPSPGWGGLGETGNVR